MLARLFEQISHPGGADANEYLDELRAGDRKKRNTGLTGDGTGEQRLAGPRRTDQQHALGRTAAEPPVSDGSFKNSTISTNSSLASSTPQHPRK